MLPIVAILGRPNVGKSTLFNRLTGTRDALVADTPGVTRDRLVGRADLGDRPCLLIDTGGLGGEDPDFAGAVESQALTAAREADALVLLTDARAGLAGADDTIAQRLRALGKPVVLAVNKAEGLDEAVLAEFHALGLGAPLAVSAQRGSGVPALTAALAGLLGPAPEVADEDAAAPPLLAIVGRPNAGKSTLVNRLLGEERLIASAVPGTTRDRVRVALRYAGRDYALLDTPGVRRRARIGQELEKLSVVKALQSIEDADVSVLVIDAETGPTEQDARIAAYAASHARATLLAVNKADLLDERGQRALAAQVERILPFLRHVPRRFISARTGQGLGGLMREVDAVHARAGRKIGTPELTRLVLDLVAKNPPPMVGTWRPRLRHAHLGGRRPLTVVIHGTRVAGLAAHYVGYLENALRAALDLEGVPLRVVLRQGENPYAPTPGTRRPKPATDTKSPGRPKRPSTPRRRQG